MGGEVKEKVENGVGIQ